METSVSYSPGRSSVGGRVRPSAMQGHLLFSVWHMVSSLTVTHNTLSIILYNACSPTVTSLESRGVSFRKSPDEIDYGAEVKLRNNGSRRLQQAIPNPYSNSELRQLIHDM